jgi:hypothetical protein
MIPESKYIQNEFMIRDLIINSEIKLAKKSMIRWLALSLGLVYPNESRTFILDILEVLMYAHIKKERLSFPQIYERVCRVSGKNPCEKSVYYHLLKLKETGFVKNRKKEYFLTEEELTLAEFLNNFYSQKLSGPFEKIIQVSDMLEKSI